MTHTRLFQIKQGSHSPTLFLPPYSVLRSHLHLFLHGQPPPPPIPGRSLPAIIHRTPSFHRPPQEPIPQRDLHDLVAATAAAVSHGAARPLLYPAAACSRRRHEAAQRHLRRRRRRARGPHGLLRRPRDEAAAAGRGVQSVRGGRQGEGLDSPRAPVVQTQVLRHLELLIPAVL